MKKILSVILCVLMVVTALPVGAVYASEEEERTDVEILIASINTLGEAEFTDSFHTKLVAAEKMYDALSAAEKEEVTNYSLLQDTRIEYNAIAGDKIDTSAYTPYVKDTDGTINWCLFTNGLLEITGEGTVPRSPWESYVDKINTVLVRDTVDSFSNGALKNIENLQVVILPFIGIAPDSVEEEAHFGAIFGYSEKVANLSYCYNIPSSSSASGGFYHHVGFSYEVYYADGTLLDDTHSKDFWYRYNTTYCEHVHPNYIEDRLYRRVATPGTIGRYIVGYKVSPGWYSEGSNNGYMCTYHYDIPVSLKHVIIKNATKINTAAFNGCRYIESIILPDSITSIEAYAFSDCRALKSIKIPESVMSIGTEAFYLCESLYSIEVPRGLQNLGDNVFEKCANLESVVLPLSISYIGEDVFSNSKVTDIWYHGGIANRAEVYIDSTNSNLFNAIWHYDTCAESHIYTASCDEACNICEWVRGTNVSHTYDNNCDARCNICNSKRTPSDHVYDNACDSTCNECGFVRITAPHKEVIDEAVAPTCLKSGLTAGTHCSVCGVVVTAQQVVPATGHNVDKNWTLLESSTCSKAGLYVKYCSNCFKIVESEDAPLAPHTLVTDKGTAATCTTSGLTDGSHCSVCKAVIVKQEVIPATHKTTGWTIVKAATCTESGLKSLNCIYCGEVMKTEAINPTEHSPVTDSAVKATCTKTGLTQGSHCSKCNIVLVKQQTIPVTTHTPSASWTVTKAATCTAEGTKVKYCIGCDVVVETAKVEKTSHTIITDLEVKPTCTKTGLTQGSHCSVCKAVIIKQEVIPATHKATGWTIVKEATCTESGLKSLNCIYCGEVVKTETIKQTEHTPVILSAVKATCTKTGLTEGSRCSKCSTILVKQQEVPKTAHTPSSSWTVIKKSTCIEEGVRVKYCINNSCNIIVNEESIDKTEHGYQETTVKNNTDGKKYTLKTCVHCGRSLFFGCEGIEKLSIPEEVTIIADYAMTDAKDLKEIEIGKNVREFGFHSVGYTATVDEATGEMMYIKNEDLIIKGYKDSAAHKYAEENGFAFVEIEDVVVLLGDVNKDGVLNIKDATTIQKHLAGIIALDEDALTVADFNQDYQVNIKDATAIQKKLAGII